MLYVIMHGKSVLTNSSRIMTGCGRVGQNRLLDRVELHTTGCVQFDPVFRTLRKNMNRLRFRFDPKREKNRTEPDLQTLVTESLACQEHNIFWKCCMSAMPDPVFPLLSPSP